jgi:5'-nucleotidase
MSEVMKPTVLVDMDGVLADFEGRLSEVICAEIPGIDLTRPRQNFYLAEDYPEYHDKIKDISRRVGFFASLELIDGALEGWQRIIDLGYKPQICSSPVGRNPCSAREKIEWLNRNFKPDFGERVAKEAIISKDKFLFPGIALIDDAPNVRGHERAIWRHILFDQGYNQGSDGTRLEGWRDSALGGYLDEAARQSEGVYNSLPLL